MMYENKLEEAENRLYWESRSGATFILKDFAIFNHAVSVHRCWVQILYKLVTKIV